MPDDEFDHRSTVVERGRTALDADGYLAGNSPLLHHEENGFNSGTSHAVNLDYLPGSYFAMGDERWVLLSKETVQNIFNAHLSQWTASGQFSSGKSVDYDDGDTTSVSSSMSSASSNGLSPDRSSCGNDDDDVNHNSEVIKAHPLVCSALLADANHVLGNGHGSSLLSSSKKSDDGMMTSSRKSDDDKSLVSERQTTGAVAAKRTRGDSPKGTIINMTTNTVKSRDRVTGNVEKSDKTTSGHGEKQTDSLPKTDNVTCGHTPKQGGLVPESDKATSCQATGDIESDVSKSDTTVLDLSFRNKSHNNNEDTRIDGGDHTVSHSMTAISAEGNNGDNVSGSQPVDKSPSQAGEIRSTTTNEAPVDPTSTSISAPRGTATANKTIGAVARSSSAPRDVEGVRPGCVRAECMTGEGNMSRGVVERETRGGNWVLLNKSTLYELVEVAVASMDIHEDSGNSVDVDMETGFTAGSRVSSPGNKDKQAGDSDTSNDSHSLYGASKTSVQLERASPRFGSRGRTNSPSLSNLNKPRKTPSPQPFKELPKDMNRKMGDNCSKTKAGLVNSRAGTMTRTGGRASECWRALNKTVVFDLVDSAIRKAEGNKKEDKPSNPRLLKGASEKRALHSSKLSNKPNNEAENASKAVENGNTALTPGGEPKEPQSGSNSGHVMRQVSGEMELCVDPADRAQSPKESLHNLSGDDKGSGWLVTKRKKRTTGTEELENRSKKLRKYELPYAADSVGPSNITPRVGLTPETTGGLAPLGINPPVVSGGKLTREVCLPLSPTGQQSAECKMQNQCAGNASSNVPTDDCVSERGTGGLTSPVRVYSESDEQTSRMLCQNESPKARISTVGRTINDGIPQHNESQAKCMTTSFNSQNIHHNSVSQQSNGKPKQSRLANKDVASEHSSTSRGKSLLRDRASSTNQCNSANTATSVIVSGKGSRQGAPNLAQCAKRGGDLCNNNNNVHKGTTLQSVIVVASDEEEAMRKCHRASPTQGWVAVSKYDVHTIVESVMSRMSSDDDDEQGDSASSVLSFTEKAMNKTQTCLGSSGSVPSSPASSTSGSHASSRQGGHSATGGSPLTPSTPRSCHSPLMPTPEGAGGNPYRQVSRVKAAGQPEDEPLVQNLSASVVNNTHKVHYTLNMPSQQQTQRVHNLPSPKTGSGDLCLGDIDGATSPDSPHKRAFKWKNNLLMRVNEENNKTNVEDKVASPGGCQSGDGKQMLGHTTREKVSHRRRAKKRSGTATMTTSRRGTATIGTAQ